MDCLKNCRLVCERIFADGLKLGGLKCEFLVRRTDVLGHTIEAGKLYPKVDKL